MASVTYTGICIGGPMNGMFQGASENRFSVHNKKPIDLFDPSVPASLEPGVYEKPLFFNYEHFSLAAYSINDTEPSDFTFWVDARIDPRNRTQIVMDALMTSYHR